MVIPFVLFQARFEAHAAGLVSGFSPLGLYHLPFGAVHVQGGADLFPAPGYTLHFLFCRHLFVDDSTGIAQGHGEAHGTVAVEVEADPCADVLDAFFWIAPCNRPFHPDCFWAGTLSGANHYFVFTGLVFQSSVPLGAPEFNKEQAFSVEESTQIDTDLQDVDVIYASSSAMVESNVG